MATTLPTEEPSFAEEQPKIPDFMKLMKQKEEEDEKEVKPVAKKKKKKNKKTISTIYVTGLGPNTNSEDIVSYFSKCGVILKDPETAQPHLKIFKDNDGKNTGEALITYLRPEAVNLAVQILDESQLEPGSLIRVQKATLEQQKSFPVKKAPKSKKFKAYDQSKELGWEEDENCHVVIKNMFTQAEAWAESGFFDELKEDIAEECEKKCGPVDKIKIFERNPEGVVVLKFEDHYAAERCIKLMNGRWFAKKQLEAFFYDGFTNYHVEESEEQRQKRIEEFGKWLEEDEDGKQ